MKRRTMTWPRTMTALHVRVPLLFFGLLVALGVIYYFWMMHTVFAVPKLDPEEERWYKTLAAGQMDSLAVLAAATDADGLKTIAREYGKRIAVYEGEVVFFEAETGRVLAASDPDSLAKAIGTVDVQMLHDMATKDWSFETVYPDPSNVDAYINRIFHVAIVTDRNGEPSCYLAGSFRPVVLTLEDITLDARRLWLQAILVGLAGSFLVGWVVMAWLTRRIKTLSVAVAALACGRFSHRVHDRSPDDLGRLGRDFNTMAGRIEELIQQLRDKEQFQRQLIANISHDLRTPLSSLRGYIETLGLSDKKPAQETYQHYLTIIINNLDHMERLINHLLQLSRLDAGQMPFQGEDFRLPELVESVLDRCRAQAAERGLNIDASYPSDLPFAHADPLLIGQVLQNLLDNGIKFGRPGGMVQVKIAKTTDGDLTLAVSDDGPGIPSEDLPHIFERFYVGDASRTRKGQSSGLGLAIAAKILEIHGSQLSAVSEPGKGACFSFSLASATPPHTAAS